MNHTLAKIRSMQDDPIRSAIASGHATLLVTGNVHDYTLVGKDICYRPHVIADQLSDDGRIVIRYSKSHGLKVHQSSTTNQKKNHASETRLRDAGLASIVKPSVHQNSPDEIRTVLRGIMRLLQTPSEQGPQVAVILEYVENLAPHVATAAAASDDHTVVAETIHRLANSPAVRKAGNVLICFLREGLHNILLNDLHRIDIPFPDESQTRAFADAYLNRTAIKDSPAYQGLEEGFSIAEFARLTRGLRLRDLESMFREARAEEMPLDRERVREAKASAVLQASEGTLSLMVPHMTIDEVVGMETQKKFFRSVAGKLQNGHSSSPRAILMTGPPGTAKSSFAPLLARMCGFNSVQFQNVKNMFVGESERRLRLALSLVESLSPVILFIDEITESIPNRSSGVQDGGVSLDLLAELFKFSARDDLRGKVLLLAATNHPERLDAAWHDRFTVIPFLELSTTEMSRLFPVFEKRIRGATNLDPTDPTLQTAAKLLHQKGASPRKVFDITNHAIWHSKNGSLYSEDIFAAAKDYVGAPNPRAVTYISLTSISVTSFQSYLPWHEAPDSYEYPSYLDGVVDKKTGAINRLELSRRIHEYKTEPIL